ncbi:Putative NTF2-like domain superfamily protein [Septoria linicola]|uniref:NTF2-like domain superfamily protein n=1 Tax=Septoria linicola TaxID=215465 RepID=A0A9Q9ARM1_9PEZI|nr:putative NTF2-like domain superfamily protein [Septoria linicola]USW51908.1 Putative NTF2-like domain superfamily protein [Septoria linicola]
MTYPHPDAKAFDSFMRRESEASTAASSTTAYSNTSYSTVATPASTISSPGGRGNSVSAKDEEEEDLKYHHDEQMSDVDIKPSLSSLDAPSLSSLDALLNSSSSRGPHSSDLSEVASTSKPSVQAIVTHLESVVRTFIELINARALTPDHPITASFDPKFSANTPPPWPQGTESLPAYIARLISLAAETEYRMIIQALDTHVYKNGHAGVFVTSDVVGVPPGTVRHIVAIFRFRKREGSWRCFTVEEVIGIENTGDGEPDGAGSIGPGFGF